MIGKKMKGQIVLPHRDRRRREESGKLRKGGFLRHYDAALAIHRLRPAAAHERRPERLASESPADNRISLGCVVVSEVFYDQVVAPTLGRSAGVVYVLPETRALREVFALGSE